VARIRSVKPDFWSNEKVVECSRDARLLFIGIWNFADDSGVHVASPRTLKMEIFPGDNITTEDVWNWIEELILVGLVVRYEVDGKQYLRVTGWDHQRIDKPCYKHPLEDGKVPTNPGQFRRGVVEESSNGGRTVVEESATARQPLCGGKDRKGENNNIIHPPTPLAVVGKLQNAPAPPKKLGNFTILADEPDNVVIALADKKRWGYELGEWRQYA